MPDQDEFVTRVIIPRPANNLAAFVWNVGHELRKRPNEWIILKDRRRKWLAGTFNGSNLSNQRRIFDRLKIHAGKWYKQLNAGLVEPEFQVAQTEGVLIARWCPEEAKEDVPPRFASLQERLYQKLTCHICGQRLTTSFNLLKHMDRKHKNWSRE